MVLPTIADPFAAVYDQYTEAERTALVGAIERSCACRCACSYCYCGRPLDCRCPTCGCREGLGCCDARSLLIDVHALAYLLAWRRCPEWWADDAAASARPLSELMEAPAGPGHALD